MLPQNINKLPDTHVKADDVLIRRDVETVSPHRFDGSGRMILKYFIPHKICYPRLMPIGNIDGSVMDFGLGTNGSDHDVTIISDFPSLKELASTKILSMKESEIKEITDRMKCDDEEQIVTQDEDLLEYHHDWLFSDSDYKYRFIKTPLMDAALYGLIDIDSFNYLRSHVRCQVCDERTPSIHDEYSTEHERVYVCYKCSQDIVGILRVPVIWLRGPVYHGSEIYSEGIPGFVFAPIWHKRDTWKLGQATDDYDDIDYTVDSLHGIDDFKFIINECVNYFNFDPPHDVVEYVTTISDTVIKYHRLISTTEKLAKTIYDVKHMGLKLFQRLNKMS
jgi:hypothetical protein